MDDIGQESLKKSNNSNFKFGIFGKIIKSLSLNIKISIIKEDTSSLNTNEIIQICGVIVICKLTQICDKRRVNKTFDAV